MYRFSDRLSALTSPENTFSILLAGLRADGHPLLDLTIANPTQALHEYPHSEIASALQSIQSFQYHPEPFGNLDARLAIVNHLGLNLSPRHVALTASTSEAYAILFKLLANPGDEILVPSPSYPLFEYLAQLEAVKLRSYQLNYDGSWYIDFATLESAVTERTRAIILVNPNNPTGSFLSKSDFERLTDFALIHNLPLISDEVFIDYAFAPSADRIVTLNGNQQVLTFTLNGLSKSAGMPQMKLAWIAVNGPPSDRDLACSRLELILDTYLSVSAPAQLAARQLIEVGTRIQKQIQKRLHSNLSTLRKLLTNSPIHQLHLEGGWSAILRVPDLQSQELWIARLLRESSVIVQPGYFFDLQIGASLVVSLITPETIFHEGITRVLALAQEAK